MTANLVLHAGGHRVTRDELLTLETPPSTETWYPTPHYVVANNIVTELHFAGYEITREAWALAGEGKRMFGVLDLKREVFGKDETLAVGVRNSVDRTFALGYCAGTRTFVCDNLTFSAELVVKRRHTVHGFRDFAVRVHEAVASLEGFAKVEEERIARWQDTRMNRYDRDALLLEAMRLALFPRRLMADIFEEQVSPQYDRFKDGSVYAFFSNFTTVMRGRVLRNLNEYAHTTQSLTRMIEHKVFGVVTPIEAKATPVIDGDDMDPDDPRAN